MRRSAPCLLVGLFSGSAWGATLSVDSSGSTAYLTIGSAIAAASSGDTIEVAAGTYTEAIDYGGKDLDIVGVSGASSTTLDAGGTSDFAVTLRNGETKNASLDGFTVQNAGKQGVYLHSTGLTITDVIFDELGTAGDSGGAIQATSGTVVIDDLRGRRRDPRWQLVPHRRGRGPALERHRLRQHGVVEWWWPGGERGRVHRCGLHYPVGKLRHRLLWLRGCAVRRQ